MKNMIQSFLCVDLRHLRESGLTDFVTLCPKIHVMCATLEVMNKSLMSTLYNINKEVFMSSLTVLERGGEQTTVVIWNIIKVQKKV